MDGIALDPYKFFHAARYFEENYMTWHSCSEQIFAGYLISGITADLQHCLKRYATLSQNDLDKHIRNFYLHVQGKKKQDQLEHAASNFFQLFSSHIGLGIAGFLLIIVLLIGLSDIYCHVKRKIGKRKGKQSNIKGNGQIENMKETLPLGEF